MPTALVDRSILYDNLERLKIEARGRFFWVNASNDACGCGLIQLLDVMDVWADGLFLADLSDAIKCRKMGWTKPIMINLELPGDLFYADSEKLDLLIRQQKQINWLEKWDLKNELAIHIGCRSAFGPSGFNVKDVPNVYNNLKQLQKIKIVDVVSDFAYREVSYDSNNNPLEVKLSQEFIDLRTLCPIFISDSGALLWHPDSGDHAVSLGRELFDSRIEKIFPNKKLGLKRFVSLIAEIVDVIEQPIGEQYGVLLAVVDCGKAHDMRFGRQNNPESREITIKLESRLAKVRIVGKASFDRVVIDITNVPIHSILRKSLKGKKVEILSPDVTYRVPRAYKQSFNKSKMAEILEKTKITNRAYWCF